MMSCFLIDQKTKITQLLAANECTSFRINKVTCDEALNTSFGHSIFQPDQHLINSCSSHHIYHRILCSSLKYQVESSGEVDALILSNYFHIDTAQSLVDSIQPLNSLLATVDDVRTASVIVDQAKMISSACLERASFFSEKLPTQCINCDGFKSTHSEQKGQNILKSKTR